MFQRAMVFFFPLLGVFLAASCTDQPGEDALLLYAKASAVYGEGRYAEAASMLSEEKRFLPALALQGKALFFSHENGEAEKILRKVLSINPGHIEARLFLIRLLREKGSAKEAKKMVGNILSSDPRNISALRLAAECAMDEGPEGEAAAKAYLDQAAEASLESALVFLDRARSRWIGGSREAALEDLARAKSLLPKDNPLARSITVLENTINGTEL